MSLSRIAIIAIGGLFSLLCGFNVGFAFVKANITVYHLRFTNAFLLGYVAVYIVMAPFGLSGILGGINRKKALIKSFMLQYWIGSTVITGLHVGNYLLARSWKADTIRNCRADAFGNDQKQSECAQLTNRAIQASFINTIVQGSVLIIVGVVLLFVGARQFREIEIDEDSIYLVEKASQFSADEPLVPARAARMSVAYRQHDPAGSGGYGASQKHDASYEASNYGGRYRPPSSNWGNASNYPASSLSRQPTNASTLTQSSNGSRYAPSSAAPPMPANLYDARTGQLVRQPMNAFQATPHIPMAPPVQAYQHQQPNVAQQPASIPEADDYENYWQPAVAKTLASNLTRRGLL